MSAEPRRCPAHPAMPYEDCPVCEAKIARAETADPLEDSERGQDAYEKWLDRIQP